MQWNQVWSRKSWGKNFFSTPWCNEIKFGLTNPWVIHFQILIHYPRLQSLLILQHLFFQQYISNSDVIHFNMICIWFSYMLYFIFRLIKYRLSLILKCLTFIIPELYLLLMQRHFCFVLEHCLKFLISSLTKIYHYLCMDKI